MQSKIGISFLSWNLQSTQVFRLRTSKIALQLLWAKIIVSSDSMPGSMAYLGLQNTTESPSSPSRQKFGFVHLMIEGHAAMAAVRLRVENLGQRTLYMLQWGTSHDSFPCWSS